MIYLGLCGFGLLGLACVDHPLVGAARSGRADFQSLADRRHRTAIGLQAVGQGEFSLFGVVCPETRLCGSRSPTSVTPSPGVPKEWHELSILHLADTHFIGNLDRPFFEEVARLAAEMRPDLIVFTGDLLDDLDLLHWLPATFGRLEAPLGCYYVLGNHDWFYGAAEIREEFARCGWQDVAGRSIVLEHRGHRLEIAGTELPWMGAHPEFARETGAFRLLLSHTPDHFAWARAHGVDLMLSGHNHGGQIVLPVIGPVFAPSRYGVRYAGGAFWSEPTLLYVSRGLSGRHPLGSIVPPN